MSKFTGPFSMTPDAGGRTGTVTFAFRYESDLLGRTITIPKGFWTDGASVPRWAWAVIPPWGRYGRAAVVHDYLYRWQKTTRRQADDTLLEAMWVCDTNWFDMAAIWIAVRMFGFFAWKQDKRKPLSADEIAANAN